MNTSPLTPELLRARGVAPRNHRDRGAKLWRRRHDHPLQRLRPRALAPPSDPFGRR